MTNAQEKKLASIKRNAEEDLFFGGPEKYEIKRWEIKDYQSFVSLVLETGMKGDEGTLAEVFARDRAHLFIGPRGGTTYPVHYQTKNGNWHHTERTYTGNIMAVVVAQR